MSYVCKTNRRRESFQLYHFPARPKHFSNIEWEIYGTWDQIIGHKMYVPQQATILFCNMVKEVGLRKPATIIPRPARVIGILQSAYFPEVSHSVLQ